VNEDRAARYHRLRRRTSVAGTIAGAAWLVALLGTGASAALATRVQAAGASLSWPIARPLSLAVFITVLALGWELVSLPFVFYRSFLLERKYGLSSEPLSTWVGDHLKALGLGLLLTIAAGLSVYGAIRVSGNFWWALSAGIFAGAGVLLSRIAPVLLMPLFYRFRPLDRETLRERLLTLSRRAGVPVLGAFEWGLGEKTTRANAFSSTSGKRFSRRSMSARAGSHRPERSMGIWLTHVAGSFWASSAGKITPHSGRIAFGLNSFRPHPREAKPTVSKEMHKSTCLTRRSI